MKDVIERMAEAMRNTYDATTLLIPWAEVPEHRKGRWREMAAAGLEALLTADRSESAWDFETGSPRQVLATLPADHPDLPGGQVLVRSFDGGETWEVCTRPNTYAGWSIGIKAERA